MIPTVVISSLVLTIILASIAIYDILVNNDYLIAIITVCFTSVMNYIFSLIRRNLNG